MVFNLGFFIKLTSTFKLKKLSELSTLKPRKFVHINNQRISLWIEHCNLYMKGHLDYDCTSLKSKYHQSLIRFAKKFFGFSLKTRFEQEKTLTFFTAKYWV